MFAEHLEYPKNSTITQQSAIEFKFNFINCIQHRMKTVTEFGYIHKPSCCNKLVTFNYLSKLNIMHIYKLRSIVD